MFSRSGHLLGGPHDGHTFGYQGGVEIHYPRYVPPKRRPRPDEPCEFYPTFRYLDPDCEPTYPVDVYWPIVASRPGCVLFFKYKGLKEWTSPTSK